MKQIIQSYKTGEIELADTPIPECSSNNILVRNVASLISIGTERSVIELGLIPRVMFDGQRIEIFRNS